MEFHHEQFPDVIWFYVLGESFLDVLYLPALPSECQTLLEIDDLRDTRKCLLMKLNVDAAMDMLWTPPVYIKHLWKVTEQVRFRVQVFSCQKFLCN